MVGIKSDHDYPGIFIELRGEHLNDRFKEGAVRLAWVEYSSDKQCLQTIAYGDGNADDFTHLIEHEPISLYAEIRDYLVPLRITDFYLITTPDTRSCRRVVW